MSRGTRLGLLAARYGGYLFVFISELLERPALPRLLLFSALLAGLLALTRLLMRSRTQQQEGLLVGADILLTFGVGAVGKTFYFFLLYFIVAIDIFFQSFPLSVSLAMAAASYIFLGVTAWSHGLVAGDLVQFMASMLVAFIFVAAVARFTLEHTLARRRAEELLGQVEAAHRQLQAYAAEAETLSVARERQRLAQEVHDSVAHVLTAVLIQLQALRRIVPDEPDRALARLAGMEEAVRKGLDEVRRAVRAMRPEQLETVGGLEAMRRLCDQFAERAGLRVHFLPSEPVRLSPVLEVLLYRVLQECLTNAARHGRASTVTVTLGQAGPRVEMRVRDDGVGAEEIRPGVGLGGMRQRVEAAGGRFSFRTARGEGFEALVQLLVEAPDAQKVPAR